MLAPLFDWRRVLVYTHRWLGILGGLLFLAWFVSGIVLMYAGMPTLTPNERLERLPPLDLSGARSTPAEAAGRYGLSPNRVRIATLYGRPVYRFVERGLPVTVFADDGERLEPFTQDEAMTVAARWAPRAGGEPSVPGSSCCAGSVDASKPAVHATPQGQSWRCRRHSPLRVRSHG